MKYSYNEEQIKAYKHFTWKTSITVLFFYINYSKKRNNENIAADFSTSW